MGKFQATGAHKIHSYFSASGGVLSFYSDNASTQLAFGESGEGLDVKFFGDTASAYVLWDESADTLEGASSAVLKWGGTVSVAGTAGFSGNFTFSDGITLAVGTGSGTKIATTSLQKLGFYGATATIQPVFASGQAGIADVLVALGLMRPS